MCETSADVPRRIRILQEMLEAEKEKVEKLEKEKRAVEDDNVRLRFVVSEYISKESPELTNSRSIALHELQKRMKQAHLSERSMDKAMKSLRNYLRLTTLGRSVVRDFYNQVNLEEDDDG
jgi:organic radical activating enzyme